MPSTTPIEVGFVVSLWRHPVKSMMGEELNASDVTERGLLGDRAYAIVDDSDGKVASAKNPRKWPNLFAFRAALREAPQIGAALPPVRITCLTERSWPLNRAITTRSFPRRSTVR